MIRSFSIILCLGLVACKRPSPDGAPAPEMPRTVTVKTVKLEEKMIAETITAYGNVAVLMKELEVVAVQFESLVKTLIVSAGELVEPGASLIEVTPSPDAQLLFAAAESAADSTAAQLSDVQNRFTLRLAVNQELDQAKQADREARDRVESLRKRGQGESRILKADTTGIINDIPVSIGQLVPAGTPLLSVIPQYHIEVLLGVEPEDATSFAEGAKVKVYSVNRNGIESEGTVRLVTKRINPQTRLIDTYISVRPKSPLLIDSYVKAEVQTGEKKALVVPREAVLSGESGQTVFTIKEGKAVAHLIETGIETATQTEVIANSLKAGDDIVTMGNTQLSDGIAVKVAK